MRDERGQMSVMIVGFFVVITLLAVVVINASAAYLQRQALGNLADGAALSAADAMRAERVYRLGVQSLTDIPLDERRAASLVGEYLQSSGRDFTDVRWSVQTQGNAILVRLDSRLDLPLVPPGWFASSRVVAEASGLLRVN